MNFRKVRKNVKAISPIISVLLMIAVAVVAALVTYAWVMGFIGFQTAKTGKAIQIQSITFDAALFPGNVTVYVQNVGDSQITLNGGQCLYINGTLTAANPTVANLPATQTSILSVAYPNAAHGVQVTIKVTSSDGTYSQVTQQLP